MKGLFHLRIRAVPKKKGEDREVFDFIITADSAAEAGELAADNRKTLYDFYGERELVFCKRIGIAQGLSRPTVILVGRPSEYVSPRFP